METFNFTDLNAQFIKAVSEGSVTEVKEIIKYVEAPESNDVEKWNLKVCNNEIYSLGALLNAKDEHGRTPLQIAASSGFYEICKLLIENGADLNIASKICPSPLKLAVSNKHCDVVRLLLKHGVIISHSIEEILNLKETASTEEVQTILSHRTINCAFEYFIETQTELLKFFQMVRKPLYELLMDKNQSPVRLLLFLKGNILIQKHIDQFIYLMNVLRDQFYQKANNENFSVMCHNIAYFFDLAREYLSSQTFEARNVSSYKSLDSLIKSWLKDQPTNGYSDDLLVHMNNAISTYPFKDNKIYDDMMAFRTLNPIETFYKENSYSFVPFTTCETCRSTHQILRCSTCKTVMYCSQSCQKLHWFAHKSVCIKKDNV